MTKISRDVPAHEGMTVADRLKMARIEASMTRKAVFEGTGISTSTLEKYESGHMDPNTTRLQAICDYLGVSVDWVLNGGDTPLAAATEKTAEMQATANVAETFSETFAAGPPRHAATAFQANDNAPVDRVDRMLGEMDDMRADVFFGFQRQAMATAEDIRAALKYFEPSELLVLADERGLHQDESCLDEFGIQDLFTEDLNEGQMYCGNIEERILDTAILGSDLFGIEREPLVALAEELRDDHDLEPPAWGGLSWGDHKDFGANRYFW
ncbi:MAG: helix-turn-helix transcriptional regulator [Rhodospirillales bacterium]|nr:helix-turn-helix transcriptional regulator [Rhodospirillales bacterium]